MKELRFWVVATLMWLFVFYNIERLGEPINIASFVYVLTVLIAILIIFTPWLQRLPALWLFILPLPLFLPLKVWLGYELGIRTLPFTITEICSLGLSAIFAQRIGLGLAEFREAGINLFMINQLMSRAQPFDIGQAEIYREIQRARLYQRPLSLLAVSITGTSVQLSIDRLKKEVQEKLIKNYSTASLANLLLEEMNDCDIITQRDNHFVILLPELTRESVEEVTGKIGTLANERLGLQLTFGISSFPEDEVTFEKLLERAEAELGIHTRAAGDESTNLTSAADIALSNREITIS